MGEIDTLTENIALSVKHNNGSMTGAAGLNPLPDIGVHTFPPAKPSNARSCLVRAPMGSKDADVALEEDPAPPRDVPRRLPSRNNGYPFRLSEIRSPDFPFKQTVIRFPEILGHPGRQTLVSLGGLQILPSVQKTQYVQTVGVLLLARYPFHP